MAIFGGAAFWERSQAEADAVMEQVIAAGINHIDVAPSYGLAEDRLGPWMKRQRERFFLGCKTMERTKEGAWAEMHRSFERLQVKEFDLYQLHAVNTFAELDAATAPGGALEALLEARRSGLTRFLGITGHGLDAPAIFMEALRRFDFDTVLFPINFVLYANPLYRQQTGELLATCKARDVGVMVIKTVARGPWGDRPPTHDTWYEPFTEAGAIQQAVDFALSQDVTGLCTAGDVRVLPLVIQACQHTRHLAEPEQEALIASAAEYTPLFT